MKIYTDETRVQVLTYPGDDDATARAVGLPRRTVSWWRSKFRRDPDTFGPLVRSIVDRADGDTLALVQQVRATALQEMLRRASDPKTRAGELAQIYREVRDEAALLQGRATSRTENANLNLNGEIEPLLSPAEDRALNAFLRAALEEREDG